MQSNQMDREKIIAQLEDDVRKKNFDSFREKLFKFATNSPINKPKFGS
jgi:hypothetical protein